MDYFIKNNQVIIDSISFQDLGNEMQAAVARRICSRRDYQNFVRIDNRYLGMN